MTSLDTAKTTRRSMICMVCAVPLLAACSPLADQVAAPGPKSSGSATPDKVTSPSASPTASLPPTSPLETNQASDPSPDGSTGDGTDGDGPGSTGGESPSPSQTAPSVPSGALVKTSDVPVGGGVILSNFGIVVTQPNSGSFKGFDNICPHQGCAVGQVSGGKIICPCHGSEFSITDGSVTRGPARTALGSKGVVVKSGWVCKA